MRLEHKEQIKTRRQEIEALKVEQQAEYDRKLTEYDANVAEYNKQLEAIKQQNLEYLLTQEDEIRASREVQLAKRVEQDLARWEAQGSPYENLVKRHQTNLSQNYKLQHQERLNQGWELVSERTWTEGSLRQQKKFIEYTYRKKTIPGASAETLAARQEQDTAYQTLINPIEEHHAEQERLELERNKQAESYVQTEINRINQKYESIWQQESTTYETQFEQRADQFQELQAIDTKDSLSAQILKDTAADQLHKTRYADMVTNLQKKKEAGVWNRRNPRKPQRDWTSTLGKTYEVGKLTANQNKVISQQIEGLEATRRQFTYGVEFKQKYPDVNVGTSGSWYQRWRQSSRQLDYNVSLVEAYERELARRVSQRTAARIRADRRAVADAKKFEREHIETAQSFNEQRIQGDILFRRQAEEISAKFGTTIPQVVPGRPNQLTHRVRVRTFSGQEHDVILPLHPGQFVFIGDEGEGGSITLNQYVNTVDPFETVDNVKPPEPKPEPISQPELEIIQKQQEGNKPFLAEHRDPLLKEFDRLVNEGKIHIPEGVEDTREYLYSRMKQATPKYGTHYARDGTPLRRITNQQYQQYFADLRNLGGLENTIRENDISTFFIQLQRQVDPNLEFARSQGFEFTQEAKELVAYGFVLPPEQRELQQRLARGYYTLKELSDFKNQYKSTERPETEVLVGTVADSGVDVSKLVTLQLEIDGEVQTKTMTVREATELYEKTESFNLGLKPLYVEYEREETAGKYTVYDPQAGEYINFGTGDNNLLPGDSKLAQALVNEGKIILEDAPEGLLTPQIESENPFGYSDNERTLMENPHLETWGEYWARQELTPLEQFDLSIKKTGKGGSYAFGSYPRYVDHSPVSPFVLSEHELLIGDAINYAVPVVLNTFQQAPQFIPQIFYPVPTNKEEFTPYDVPVPFETYNRVVATRSIEERIGDWTTFAAAEAAIWVTTRDVGAKIKSSALFTSAMARLKLTKGGKAADDVSGKTPKGQDKPGVKAKEDFEVVPSREQPQYVRTLVQTLEKGHPDKVIFVERQVTDAKKFLISIGTEGNDVKSPFRVLDFNKPPKTPKTKTPEPKPEPQNPKHDKLIDTYDNAPVSQVKSTSEEIAKAMQSGEAFTENVPLSPRLVSHLKNLKELIFKPAQAIKDTKSKYEVTQRTKPTPPEPKYDTSKYAFDDFGRFGFPQTNRPSTFTRVVEKLTDFQYRGPFNKVVVKKPSSDVIYSYPDEQIPPAWKSVFSDLAPESGMRFDVKKIGDRAYEITPNVRKKVDNQGTGKKSNIEDKTPLTDEELQLQVRLALQLVDPNFFSQVGKRSEVSESSSGLHRIFAAFKEAESNFNPDELSLITQSKHGPLKKPNDADVGPKHEPKDWTETTPEQKLNNVIPGTTSQTAKKTDEAAKTLGESGKQQAKEVSIPPGARERLRDFVVDKDFVPSGQPVITPKPMGDVLREGLRGGISGVVRPPPNVIETPTEITGERIIEGTVTGTVTETGIGERIKEGIGHKLGNEIVQEHQRDLLKDWIRDIDGFKGRPRERPKPPKGINLPRTRLKPRIIAMPDERIREEQKQGLLFPPPIHLKVEPVKTTKPGKRPPPLFFTTKLRQKRLKRQSKFKKNFIGNVPLSSLVGIYNRKEITYGDKRVKQLKTKELKMRKRSRFTETPEPRGFTKRKSYDEEERISLF